MQSIPILTQPQVSKENSSTCSNIYSGTPFIISAPDVVPAVITTPVELVDLFPTLVDYAGLPKISNCPLNLKESRQVQLCTEGTSLFNMSNQSKLFAISQYGRPSIQPQENSDLPDRKDIKFMGYRIKTISYSYTAWFNFDTITNQPVNISRLVAEQLYDIKRGVLYFVLLYRMNQLLLLSPAFHFL